VRTAVAQLLMALATHCLGDDRREWAQAMQAEYDEAGADGRQLGFAAGCLIVAWREMPRHAEGRLFLADHALALGLLVPVAFLQFACAIGLSSGPGGMYGVLAMIGGEDPYLANAQFSAMPVLLVLWLLLGAAHLRLAWTLLDRNWVGVVQAGSLIGAAALTLVTMVAVVHLQAAFLAPVMGVMVIELIFVAAASRLHGYISPEATLVRSAW